MRRRSGASGEADQPRSSAAKTPTRRNAPKAAPVSGAAGVKTEVARLALELAEARERQAAASEVLSLIADAPTNLLLHHSRQPVAS